MKLLALFIFSFVLLCATPPQSKLLEKLSYDPYWLQLLHYDTNHHQSTIITKKFFLHPQGAKNPLLELQKTVAAYNQNHLEILCRYPARYRWLSKKLHWKTYRTTNYQCHSFHIWKHRWKNHSISAVFVSGFLGNPASAFGHSFFKINQDKKRKDLLDWTISYGAILPHHYTMWSYIYNGLTGGYKGRFLDQYYYINDMVYSNHEFRDMWEFELNLTQKEKERFFEHMWELKDVSFQYYFFNRNCGYKVSEMLSFATQRKLIESADVWYAPIETFYKLEQYPHFIRHVYYIPSAQHKIYAFFHSLTIKEREEVTAIIEQEKDMPHVNSTLSQIKILDFVLDFYTYKLHTLTEGSEPYNRTYRIKAKYLQQRLLYPFIPYEKSNIVNKQKMTKYYKPTFFSLGTLYHKKTKYKGIYIAYAPFSIEALGYNAYEGDILSIFYTELSFISSHIVVSKLDLLKIRRLKTNILPFDIENPISWSLYIGSKKNIKRDYFAAIGAGYSWKLGQHYKLYTMIETSFHLAQQHYRIYPYAGILATYDKNRYTFEYGKENRYSNHFDAKWNLGLQIFINAQSSFCLSYEYDQTKQLKYGIKWFF